MNKAKPKKGKFCNICLTVFDVPNETKIGLFKTTTKNIERWKKSSGRADIYLGFKFCHQHFREEDRYYKKKWNIYAHAEPVLFLGRFCKI